MSTRSRKSLGPNTAGSRLSMGSTRESMGGGRESMGMSSREDRDNAAIDNNESIKVICRFRPTRDAKQNIRAEKGVERIDSFILNTQNAEVQFLTDMNDGKTFKFDKVRASSICTYVSIVK